MWLEGKPWWQPGLWGAFPVWNRGSWTDCWLLWLACRAWHLGPVLCPFAAKPVYLFSEDGQHRGLRLASCICCWTVITTAHCMLPSLGQWVLHERTSITAPGLAPWVRVGGSACLVRTVEGWEPVQHMERVTIDVPLGTNVHLDLQWWGCPLTSPLHFWHLGPNTSLHRVAPLHHPCWGRV